MMGRYVRACSRTAMLQEREVLQQKADALRRELDRLTVDKEKFENLARLERKVCSFLTCG